MRRGSPPTVSPDIARAPVFRRKCRCLVRNRFPANFHPSCRQRATARTASQTRSTSRAASPGKIGSEMTSRAARSAS
ncbi:MAG: hypothetical protein OXU61_04705, partial [Gammaproteobacteria bacterium]|nr:hypothetical protein [Gammaproteobacteria bacterium]